MKLFKREENSSSIITCYVETVPVYDLIHRDVLADLEISFIPRNER